MISLRLAFKSILHRRLTACLSLLAIALSVALLLGVERVREGAKTSFENTISDTDLLVGARGGALQLLLYSVFRIGAPTNNMTWQSYEELAGDKRVAWTIPLTLGDSHRGYRVLGTNDRYFEYYKYGRQQKLSFASGKPFAGIFDAVIGAEVAKQLGYKLGDQITLSHGVQSGADDHADKPFQIVGIINKTHTAVDRTIHISLEGIEAVHIDWQGGKPPRPGESIAKADILNMQLKPKSITAMLVGLRSKFAIFRLQRQINYYQPEALMAVMPGLVLQQLWDIVSVVELALKIVALFVVITGLVGMLTAVLTTLNERRREMAVLRSLGARPKHIFALLVGEAGFLTIAGVVMGIALLYMGLWLSQPWVETQFGLFLEIRSLAVYDALVILSLIGGSLLLGLFPAWRAYRQSLVDGLTVKV